MGKRSWYDDPANEAHTVTFAGTIAIGLLIAGWIRLRGTTLLAPLLWCFVAVVVLLAAVRVRSPYVDYAAAVTMVAPTLALLGAKRPQNGAWQFIVLTLVGVLLLPVVQGLAFGDDRPHVHTLFRWLLAVHIFIGIVNYLPTRFAGPAIAFGLAQASVAFRFLPGMAAEDFAVQFSHPILAGSAGFLAALVWSHYLSANQHRPASLDRLWRDFRDMYGLVWGLRIAERLNAAAQKHGWPVEFAWGGMIVRTESGELDAETRHRVERELRSHLRRFVSHEWIVRRLQGGG